MNKPPTDLGSLAVSMGWITQDALEEAIAFQKEATAKGQALRIGQVLVDRQHITAAQLRALLTLQGKGIVVCPGCKKQYNAASFRIGASVKCPSCGAQFTATGSAVDSPAVDGTVILLDDDVGGKTEIRRRDDAQIGVPRQFGKYQVVAEIARGGMGIVYRATEMGLGRSVALKVLIAGEEAGDDQIDRFIREARSAAKLRHPNIVAIHDVGVEHGHHYFTMDLIEGCSIENLLRERIAIQPADALRIARDVAYALHYAHQHAIIHRDLKPGNILLEFTGGPRAIPKNEESGPEESNRFAEKDAGVTRKGLFQLRPEDRVYLTDFGLAKEVGADSTRLTRTGMTMGTPAYMSPEQARGRIEEVEPRSDVFALGSVLYEMITGRPPFRGDSIIDVMMRVASKDPLPVRHINPQIHPDIETICLKALEKDKDRRYPSALAMAADIESYLGGEAISARPQSVAFRMRRSIRRNAGLAAAVSITAMAITLAFVIPRNVLPWIQGRNDERRLREEQDKVREREGQVEVEARRLVRRAVELHEQGAYGDALSCASAAAADFPAPAVLPEAYFVAAQAQAALDAGRGFLDAAHDPSSRLYAHAYETGSASPWGPRALLAIGRRLAARHDHARAVTVFSRILQRYPDAQEIVEARVGLARALAAVGRPDQAAALFAQGDPPPDTSQLRALLAPFGRIRRDPLGAQFSHVVCRGSGLDAQVHLAREGELITVTWAEAGGAQVAREPLPAGTPIDLLTDGREVYCVLARPGGTLQVATRLGDAVDLDPSWRWAGGRAACADLDGDGTPELYLPLVRQDPLVARLRPGGRLEPVVGLSYPAADGIDLHPFSSHGGPDGLVVAARFGRRGELRVATAAAASNPAVSAAVPIDGLIGVGSSIGEVIAVRTRDGRLGVFTMAWTGGKLVPSAEIALDVRAARDCVASVTTRPGTPPPIVLRLEGGAEDAILLLKRPETGPEWIEVGSPRGGGAVFSAGTRLFWVERHGSLLATGIEGGKSPPPSLPPLSPTPTALELAQDLLDLGLADEAVVVLDRLLAPLEGSWDGRTQSRPIAEAYLARARACAAHGDLDRAFESLQRAERASSLDLPRTLRLRADLLLAAGKRDLAAEALARLLNEGNLSEGDAERVQRELDLVSAWSTARKLVDEDFRNGKVAALAGNFIASDPLRARLEAGGLVLRLGPSRPSSYGVPLHLDGNTFEASATLVLPLSTAATKVEWGLFREGEEGPLVVGAIAEGQGPESVEGYRWSARVPGAPAPEEAGRWALVVPPQARVVLSYESRSRRVELRVETGAEGVPAIVWAGDLASDFPAGDYRFGLRAWPCEVGDERREVKAGALAFRAATLASSLQWPGGTEYERACGAASMGELTKALGVLERIAPATPESRAARVGLLADDPASGHDAAQALEKALAEDEAGTLSALGALLPSLRPEGAALVLEGLAKAFAGRPAMQRKSAAREALHRGDAMAAAASLASLAGEEGAEAECAAWYAEALFRLDQPSLAALQAARVVRGITDKNDQLRMGALSLLWRCWLGSGGDARLVRDVEAAGEFPVVVVVSVDPDGVAGAAGFRPGDRIYAVGGSQIRLIRQFQQESDHALASGRGALDVRVVRARQEVKVALPVGPMGMTLREEWESR